MKKTKQCPKCESTDIRIGEGPPYTGILSIIPIGWNKFLNAQCYVCLSCGFTELYAKTDEINDEIMKEIEEKWDSVQQS
jgi:predicted nucleic-acid-binding Zn-ribbon protein